MRYKVENGIYKLGSELSKLERNLFREFEDMLEQQGFIYLSIPSIMSEETLSRQDIGITSLGVSKEQLLTGSAEQGILEYFADSRVEEQLIYAKNQCFRLEKEYYGLKYCKEFIKLEQYCFTTEKNWETYFNLVLNNAITFLKNHNIEYRVIDTTKRDSGYHKLKYDIEVLTKEYGWLETHSCTYFGEEQSRRYGITGATHTISNTGIASPRILVPFIERGY